MHFQVGGAAGAATQGHGAAAVEGIHPSIDPDVEPGCSGLINEHLAISNIESILEELVVTTDDRAVLLFPVDRYDFI